MKTFWMGAAAAAAITLAASPVLAHEAHVCLDAFCFNQALFTTTGDTGGGEAVSLESPRYGAWGFDLAGMDRAARPGDDFYIWASGGWNARTEIPSDRTRFGNFDVLSILSEARTKAIIEDAAAGRIGAGDAAMIGAAYGAFMDEARVEALDIRPLSAELSAIRRVKTRDDMTALMGRANVSGFSGIFGLGIGDDAKNPSRYAVYAGTGGLGLPDRDYYLDPKFGPKKAAYEAYIVQMLTMAGWPRPAEAAKAIVAFETRLAEASWTRIERRDRDKTYNPMTLAELQAATPGFNWNRYLVGTELKGVDRYIVSTNTAFPKFAAIYSSPRSTRSRLGRLSIWWTAPRRCCRVGSSTPTSSSAPGPSPASRSRSRAGSGRWPTSTMCSESRSASSTSPVTSRRNPRPRWRPWWPTSARR